MGKQGRKGKRRKLAEELYKLLCNDILKRYNKKEYWDPDVPRKERKRHILGKYNFVANWDKAIVDKFQKDHGLTVEQMAELQHTIVFDIQRSDM